MPIISDVSRSMPLALFISDGSGVSAEAYGEAVLSQMGPENFRRERAVFCKTPTMARQAGALAMAERMQGRKVCVFSTLAMPESRQALKEVFPDAIDLFDIVLPLACHSLQMESQPRVGASHGAYDTGARAKRAEAIDYALSRDDGARANYADAEIILVGVSRSGKTPCCMWLAMHYGLRAANYPLTEEDLLPGRWPAALHGLESICAGLTLSAQRLSDIRQARLRGSRYASTQVCAEEIAAAAKLMRIHGVPSVDTTGQGVEEICAALITAKDLHPPLSF